MSWEKILKFKLTKDADELGQKSEGGSSYNNRFTLDDLQKIADRLNYRIEWLKNYYAKDNEGGLE